MPIVPSVEFEYRLAFEDFSRTAKRVQELTENPYTERNTFETALLELEKAHLRYNQARDALVRSLLEREGVTHSSRGETEYDHRSDVQAIAELLWEGAGRPEGSAEEDWHRAEAIVNCAIEATECAIR